MLAKIKSLLSRKYYQLVANIKGKVFITIVLA